MNKYFCLILGENQNETKAWHSTTLNRAKAFAISIHLPVLIWLVIGYLLSTKIFGLSPYGGLAVSSLCGLVIFMIERLVIAAPKSLSVTLGRLVIALVVAIIGSAGFDLVMFEKEVEAQLKVSAKDELKNRYQTLITAQAQEVESRRLQWKTAEEKAQCEANGTCGSGIRSVGPVFRQAKQHANDLRNDFQNAERKLEAVKANYEADYRALEADGTVTSSAGLLARIKALHQYVFTDGITLSIWLVIFLLLTAIELMVVFVKLSFGETVDDQLAKLKEQVRFYKANQYASAVMSPYADANDLMNSLHRSA